jgi:membrane associated rhomboid family serine protease
MLPLGDVERTQITPVGTYALIAMNVVIYLLQINLGDQFTTAFAATPYEITHDVDLPAPFVLTIHHDAAPDLLPVRRSPPATVIPQAPVPFPVWMTLFTAMFLHGGPMHLAGNMLYLWIFGDNVEEVLGTARFIVIYVCFGLAGSLAQILANPDSLIPTLGASGAIAGIMGTYLVWFPHNRIRVLFFYFVTEVPAVVVIGLWIGLQVISGLGSIERIGNAGGVAYLAHVGGAACGIVVGLLYQDEARRLRGPEVVEPPSTWRQGRRPGPWS